MTGAAAIAGVEIPGPAITRHEHTVPPTTIQEISAPTITALGARRAGTSGAPRVAVELDGHPWRAVPLEALVGLGLGVGSRLDRPAARALARELRRLGARDEVLRALRRRDHTRAALERRLVERRTPAAQRRETLDAAERAGLVDDVRFCAQRAEQLSERGAGDALIADDLHRRGAAPEAVRAALDALEPELVRAARIVRTRGDGIRTLRYLAARGFSDEVIEGLVAEATDEG